MPADRRTKRWGGASEWRTTGPVVSARPAGVSVRQPRTATERNPTAVVIGLDSATGLQTARILARRGVPVIGIAADAKHPCCRTRVCDEITIASTTTPELVDTLLRLGAGLAEKAVLFPCTDLSVLQLSRRRDEVQSRFHLVLPDAGTVEMLIDKARFARWAEQEGLPVPRTRVLQTADDAEAAAQVLRFPCVVKPSVKLPGWSKRARAKAFLAEDSAALRALFARCSPWAESLVVQEWIAGSDDAHFTCNCYFTKRGEPVVSFTSRKVRQWTPFGGEGSLSVEVANETVLRETLRLFRCAGHRGLAYAEIKRHAHTGEYLIIEPNIGRPTGRSAQAEASGVELLFAQYCDALDRPLPAARQARHPSVKWIYWRRDLQAAFHQWRHGELTVQECLRSWRGPKQDALFSWTDPAPFWADLGRAARLFIRRSEPGAPPLHDEEGAA